MTMAFVPQSATSEAHDTRTATCRLAVLLTCHNRRQATLRCLAAVDGQRLPERLLVSVFLLDDGSTDGTGEMVGRTYPQVRLLEGSGDLFWCGGMRQAFAKAMQEDFDYYVWLNDDTILHPQGLNMLLSVAGNAGNGNIVVGTTTDPRTGQPSYGGVKRRSRWHPFRFTLVVPGDRPVHCDTMNGNCVLVPRRVAQATGNLDPAFDHGFGDYDYGLRARRAGFGVLVAPGTVGTCPRNQRRLPWRDPALNWRQRWAAVTSRKGLPPREMMIYARRHGGPLWPLFWCMPYLRALLLPTRRPVAVGKPL